MNQVKQAALKTEQATQEETKSSDTASEQSPKLEVAWRYRDSIEDRMLGAA